MKDNMTGQELSEALKSGRDMVSVTTLGYRDGEVGPVTDHVERSEAIRRMKGHYAAKALADNPNVRVIALMQPDGIKRWLSPEEYQLLVTHLPK